MLFFRFLISVCIFLNFTLNSVFASSTTDSSLTAQKSVTSIKASDSLLKLPNYLSSTIIDGSHIVRWQKLPVKVYIQDCEYSKIVKSAFLEWQNKTGNAVSFFFCKSPKEVEITVNFVDRLCNSYSKNGYEEGITKPYFSSNKLLKAEISLVKIDPKTNKDITLNHMYSAALHEIGHSIGLIDHSPNPNDIMYNIMGHEKKSLSSRDINTVKILYSDKINNYKQAPMALKQKIQFEKENIKKFPNNPYCYLKLADLYRAKKDYAEAIHYYQKAVKLDSKFAQSYYSMGISYYLMKDFDNSYKNFLTAIQKDPDNPKYIQGYAKICSQTGQKEKAQKYLEKFVLNHPNLKNDIFVQNAFKILNR